MWKRSGVLAVVSLSMVACSGEPSAADPADAVAAAGSSGSSSAIASRRAAEGGSRAEAGATQTGGRGSAGAPSDGGARSGDDRGTVDTTMPNDPSKRIDRSHLQATGSAPLDYADRALWACRPGNDPDECNVNLDATEILKDGSSKLVPFQRAADPAFDCFYMYPTVYFDTGNMQDFRDLTALHDPLRSQIARFSSVCKVYVPLYRQSSTGRDRSHHLRAALWLLSEPAHSRARARA